MELVPAPWSRLGCVVLQVADGPVRIVALLDVPLVPVVDVVVEGVLECQGEELVGALHFEGHSPDDCFVCAPRKRDASRSVEQSGSHDIGLEVLLNAAFLHGPANDLNDRISVISDFNLVQAVAAPVIALGHIPAVEVEVRVVVVAEIVGGVHVGTHQQNMAYLGYFTDLYSLARTGVLGRMGFELRLLAHVLVVVK